jgi:type I restriction enzyme, S subunit
MRRTVNLGELVTIRGGGTPDRKNPNYWGGSIPWASVKDLKSLVLKSTQEFITEEGVKSSATNVIPPGTVIIGTRMAVGKACITELSVAINQDLKALFCSPKLLPQYLLWFLTCSSQQLENQATGATVKGVKIDALNMLKIPLPPLEEQRRIAAILDKADEVRRKRQQAIALTEELLRSLFLDMFGDPVTNPKGWEVVKLGIVTDSKLGKMLSESARKGISPVKYLGNTHVRWRSFNLEELPEMDFSDTELQKLDLRYGDLIVCEGGEVGRCAIWRNELENISFQKALHRIRCQTTKVIPEYLQEYFVFMAKRGGLVSSTSSATIAHLTGVRLKQLPLPLPLISEQRSFQKIYKMYEQLMFKYNRDYKEIEILFNSLLQKAFRGEL